MRESLRLGAGWLVSGSLVGSARNLIITARVITTDGQRRDVVTVTGPVDSLGALADSLARGLLLATFAEAAQRADELGQVPLAALRPYLLARSASRGGAYARAPG